MNTIRRYRTEDGHELVTEWLDHLKDRQAKEYLQAAMEDDEEPAVLLLALRQVAEAYGMPKVAELAGIQRESLYRALSPQGNPTLRTLTAVLEAVGLRLTVTPDRHGLPQAPALAESGR
jgi:probable addiction module antidote protein